MSSPRKDQQSSSELPKYHLPHTDLTFKTSMQKRDPHFAIPDKVNVWDQLVLQDTLNKKLEDEAYLQKQYENRLQMREFYLSQIRDK